MAKFGRAGCVLVLVFMVACGSDGGDTSSSSSEPSSSASSSPSSEASPSSNSATDLPEVDLTVTGKHPFVAKGSKGRCVVVNNQFGFELTGDDYPGAGLSFSVAELNPTDIKWTFTRDEVIGNADGGILAVTPDHHSIAIDTDLTGPPDGAVVGHVKGSITCP